MFKRVIIINTGEIVYNGLLSDLTKEYIKKKFIEVKFEEKTHVNLPKRACLISRTPYVTKFEIPIKKKGMDDFIVELIKEYPVEDIIISDPPIEEIIRDIYENDKC